MKNLTLIVIAFLCPILMFSQNLEVEGKAKITVMDDDVTADSLVVLRPGGELARRHVSSLPDSTGGWNENVDTTSTMKYVGIGTTSPTEKLDIEGAINIGINADASPEPGTIRWNDNLGDFEGHTGTQWKSLTKHKSFFGRPDLTYNSTENNKLTASDDTEGDNFGISVSISGDYVIVGAYRDDDGGSNSGSAYIFTRSGSAWIQQAKLTASDAAAGDIFGISVSISEDYAIVGSSSDDDGGSNSGSAYIFKKPGGGWTNMTQTAKLTASDAAAGDSFGRSVSISGDYAILGSSSDDDGGSNSGSAYIFKKPGAGWTDMTQTAKLTASDAAAGDSFGTSVSIYGDYAIVSALFDDDGGTDSGSAYIFKKPGGGWTNMTQTAKLTASDADIDDQFGIGVSISGDYAIIGAFRDDDGGAGSGSAYIFKKPGAGWTDMTQTAKLTASDASADDLFGRSVSISGDYAIVGAYHNDDGGADSGSAYIFEKPGGGWTNMTQTAKLTASDAAGGDIFGINVSISGDYAIVGAYNNDDGGVDSGSAYIY